MKIRPSFKNNSGITKAADLILKAKKALEHPTRTNQDQEKIIQGATAKVEKPMLLPCYLQTSQGHKKRKMRKISKKNSTISAQL